MITGDYHHTAIAVAKDVGMLKQEDHVIIIDAHRQPELQANVAAVPCATDTSSLRFQVSAVIVASNRSMYGTLSAASGKQCCGVCTSSE